jgi:hypothetical protein
LNIHTQEINTNSKVICIGVVLFGVVVMLHLFAVLYSFSPFVCFILMVEFYNIFADLKNKIPIQKDSGEDFPGFKKA